MMGMDIGLDQDRRIEGNKECMDIVHCRVIVDNSVNFNEKIVMRNRTNTKQEITKRQNHEMKKSLQNTRKHFQNVLSRTTRWSNVRSTLCWFTEFCNS